LKLKGVQTYISNNLEIRFITHYVFAWYS